MMRGLSSLTIAASGGGAQAASSAEGASGCVWFGLGAGSIVGRGKGVVGSCSEPRKASEAAATERRAGAGRVVTQHPRVECITRTWVSPFFAWGCGDGGKFCDANGSIVRPPPEVPKVCGAHGDEGDAALGDVQEGVEAGKAAGFWWCLHIADFEVSIGWTRVSCRLHCRTGKRGGWREAVCFQWKMEKC